MLLHQNMTVAKKIIVAVVAFVEFTSQLQAPSNSMHQEQGVGSKATAIKLQSYFY